MTMEPNTIASAITCSVSTIGNSHSHPSSPRIAAASEGCSAADRKPGMVIRTFRRVSEIEFPGAADESAADDEPDPEPQGNQREPLGARRTGRRIPFCRLAAHRTGEADRQRQDTNDHEHLPPERRC